MRCEHTIVTPLDAIAVEETVMLERKKHFEDSGICVHFYSGDTRVYWGRNEAMPCFATISGRPRTEVVLPWFVTRLPGILEAYFLLGTKIRAMFTSFLEDLGNVSTVFYFDVDVLQRMDAKKVWYIVGSFKHMRGPVAMGDVLDCLTPANQVCCCRDGHYSSFWNRTRPFERGHPILYGGAGMGFNRPALLMMRRNVLDIRAVHPFGDHTISNWAKKAHVSLVQWNVTSYSSRWCPGLERNHVRLNANSWMCHRTKRVHHWKGDTEKCDMSYDEG